MTADEIYVDPSALSRLYLHQDGSRQMAAWRKKIKGSLPVTHHGRVEVINAINLAAFRGQLPFDKAAAAQVWFEDDFTQGHLTQADVLWRAALNRAAQLSHDYTGRLGVRSLDIIHVACALELKLRRFLTLDARQQKLVLAAGLKLVRW